MAYGDICMRLFTRHVDGSQKRAYDPSGSHGKTSPNISDPSSLTEWSTLTDFKKHNLTCALLAVWIFYDMLWGVCGG